MLTKSLLRFARHKKRVTISLSVTRENMVLFSHSERAHGYWDRDGGGARRGKEGHGILPLITLCFSIGKEQKRIKGNKTTWKQEEKEKQENMKGGRREREKETRKHEWKENKRRNNRRNTRELQRKRKSRSKHVLEIFVCVWSGDGRLISDGRNSQTSALWTHTIWNRRIKFIAKNLLYHVIGSEWVSE